METKKNDAHFSISLNSVAKQLVWEIIREIQIVQREDTFCEFCWIGEQDNSRKKKKEKKKFGRQEHISPLAVVTKNSPIVKKEVNNTANVLLYLIQ